MVLRRRVFYKLPKWIRLHSFEVFLSGLCALSAIPLLLGETSAQSVEAILPRWIVFCWALTLLWGPVLTVSGLYMGIRLSYPDRLFWQRLEAWGLSMLAYVGYLYSLCIFLFLGVDSLVAAAIILGFGMTCHFRVLAILVGIYEFLEGIGAKHGR
jgi:hypothetical protein